MKLQNCGFLWVLQLVEAGITPVGNYGLLNLENVEARVRCDLFYGVGNFSAFLGKAPNILWMRSLAPLRPLCLLPRGSFGRGIF